MRSSLVTTVRSRIRGCSVIFWRITPPIPLRHSGKHLVKVHTIPIYPTPFVARSLTLVKRERPGCRENPTIGWAASGQIMG
jgi:hypothetical protein